MGYQPWYQGDTYAALQITLASDTANDNITTVPLSNFAMTLRSTGGVDTTGTGTFTIVSASPAIINYQFSSADVATPGTYSLFVKVTFPGPNGGVAVYDPIPFTITAA